MGTLFVDKLDPQSGTSLEIGSSGDTMTVPSGATFNVAGTLQSGGAAIDNTPAFSATLSSNFTLTQNTLTLVPFATEQWDIGSAYDNSASQYKFTAPLSGKYNIFTVIKLGNQQSGTWNYGAIYKNGSSVVYGFGYTSVTQDGFLRLGQVLDLSANDTIQIYATTNQSGTIFLGSDSCVFQGNKLIT